jgi:hypothetical protein
LSDIGTDRDGEERRIDTSEELASKAAANGQLFKLNKEAADGTRGVSNLNS